MTNHLTRFLLLVLVALLAANLGQAAEPSRRPNVILIMADDFGYEGLSCNGSTSYKTPHLDRLAAGGMRFDRCYAQPLCTPTRVQLMTGLYNVRNYIRFGLLDPQAATFGHRFKNAGYATSIVGKWQLGVGFDGPSRFGFDDYCLWQLTRRPPRYANPGLEFNGKQIDYGKGEYGPDLVNAHALDFIQRHQDRPFFLYYPMILTHDPYQPTPDSPDWDPKAMGEAVNRNVKHFAEMTAYMDKLIGRLAAKLDELKLRENTLIIFLGDNGTGRGVTSRLGDRTIQGGKGLTTSAGMHVPLVVNWKGTVPVGKVCSDLIDSTDFLPTICAAAGIKVDGKLDGRSFLPQLKGEKGTPREWIYCWYSRDGGAKQAREFAATLRYKLYRTGEFYDYQADANEKQPLPAGEAAAERTKLQSVLDDFKGARPKELSKQ